MSTVACVLRSGGAYNPEWVARLATAARRHGAQRVLCLSDVPLDCDVVTIPLVCDWPGWWAKIELFRPGLFVRGERVLYLDLDTAIVGDLADLLSYRGEFAMLADFYSPDTPASGVMAWRAGSPVTSEIFDAFYGCEQELMGAFGSSGDQGFIGSIVPRPELLQRTFPRQIVSYKLDCAQLDAPPAGARLVCLHGKPKFPDFPEAHWMRRAWIGA